MLGFKLDDYNFHPQYLYVPVSIVHIYQDVKARWFVSGYMRVSS